MSENWHCEHENSSGSSFTFGLIIGLIIGAIVAIILYRQSKGKILDELKAKFESFFNSEPEVESKPVKKPVVLPKKIIAAIIPKPPAKTSKPKLFKKPKA